MEVVNLRDIYNRPIQGRTYLKIAENTLSRVLVFPNPCPLSDPAIPGPTFGGLTPLATIRIYTPEGALIRTLRETNGDGGITWNGRNEQGVRVGSGVYLYLIEGEGEQRIGRFALIR
jgi:hypothetical protein